MDFLKRLFSRKETIGVEAAHQMGRDFGEHLGKKIEAFGEERMDDVAANMLGVFKQQLQVLDESGEADPRHVAGAHLTIFRDEVKKFYDRMWEELLQNLEPDLRGFKAAGLPLDAIHQLMNKTLDARVDFLIIGGMTLYKMRLRELGVDTDALDAALEAETQ